MIIDVKYNDIALGLGRGLARVPTCHREVQARRPLVGGEGAEHPSHPRRRRRAVRAEQRCSARRHQTPHPIDTSYPQRERAN
jgi:hypothetical protein